jgi:hypothetical protein
MAASYAALQTEDDTDKREVRLAAAGSLRGSMTILSRS